MNKLTTALFDLKLFEQMANRNSPVHRLHPLAKVITTLLFIISVVSFTRYQISALLPFMLFPLLMIAKAELAFKPIAHKLLLLLPFILLVAIWNPLFDRTTLVTIGDINLSGGTISFVSLIIRSMLTISAAFILIATTGFNAICHALRQVGLPQVFVNQLLFLYRYLFVLAEEASRASLARELRCYGNQGQGIASYASLTGTLLLRTWGRAERIHSAMLTRGFSGEFHTVKISTLNRSDLQYLFGCCLLLLLFRFYNLPLMLGAIVTGFFK